MRQVRYLTFHPEDCTIQPMNGLRLPIAVLTLALAAAACQVKEDPSSGMPADGGFPPIPAPADVAAPPADALRTPSGIASKVLTVGLGSIHPGPKSMVRVIYTGWTADGKMFDSSLKTGQPAEFGLYQVIPGWTEALQLMVVGEKRRFWIPGKLAYDGDPGKPQGQLCFEIELLDIR
jgi:peptidylprolyl isomerase